MVEEGRGFNGAVVVGCVREDKYGKEAGDEDENVQGEIRFPNGAFNNDSHFLLLRKVQYRRKNL